MITDGATGIKALQLIQILIARTLYRQPFKMLTTTNKTIPNFFIGRPSLSLWTNKDINPH